MFFKKEKILVVSAALTGFFFLLALALGVANFQGFEPPLILHFDQYRGADLLGGLAGFWLIFVGVLAIMSFNLFLAAILWEREKFLSYFLFLANLLLSIVLLMVIAVIINTN